MLAEGQRWSDKSDVSCRQLAVNSDAQTCVQTPSTTSTRTRAPSHNREAVETSLEKSTCPGVSIILMTYVFEPGVL